MATKRKSSSKAKTKKASTKKSTETLATKVGSKTKLTSYANLRRWNATTAVLLALQAIAIILIGKAFTLPIVTNYLTTDTLATQAANHTVLAPAVRHLFDIDIRYLVMAYLLIAALFYAAIATFRRSQYEAELKKSVNSMRWIGYGLSSGIMFILIAMLNGVYDSSTLLAIFVLVGLLHTFGYFAEAKATVMRYKLQNFAGLVVAGATVWLIIAMYLKGTIFYGTGQNHFVYWIDGVIFVLTLGLGYNKLQSLRAKGRWSDYIFGERLFMILTFVGQTALTWLVFAGFLK